jgi:hypothetical protein
LLVLQKLPADRQFSYDDAKVKGFIRLPKKYTDNYENRPPTAVERRFLSEYLSVFRIFSQRVFLQAIDSQQIN